MVELITPKAHVCPGWLDTALECRLFFRIIVPVYKVATFALLKIQGSLEVVLTPSSYAVIHFRFTWLGKSFSMEQPMSELCGLVPVYASDVSHLIG
jgi:hypothetical protein